MKRARRNRRKAARRELPKLPPLPRFRVNWHAVLGPPLVLASAMLLVTLGRELLDIPVRKLVIEGSFQRVTELEIQAAVAPALSRGFVALDLDEIKARVAAIDWVDGVRLRRVWPDELRISYTEHRAAASWGGSGLLNTRGELFAENLRHDYRELPKLTGPEGSHERVALLYLALKDQLADANLRLESIEMDARGAFEIALAGGTQVRFGRDDVAGRIDRFLGVALPELQSELRRVAYVDMRYPNGFAVGWHEAPAPRSELARVDSGG
jgi:cell division protein FtsQ